MKRWSTVVHGFLVIVGCTASLVPYRPVIAQTSSAGGPAPMVAKSLVPETTVPDIAVADIAVADIAVADIAVADIIVADITVADVPVPDVPVPDVSAPDLVAPDVTAPKISQTTDEEAAARHALAFDAALARVPIEAFTEHAGAVVTCSVGQHRKERLTDPNILSFGLAQLRLKPDESILVIGDATGFITAVLSSLQSVYPQLTVHTIEEDAVFRSSAQAATLKLGLATPRFSGEIPGNLAKPAWQVVIMTEPQSTLPLKVIQALPRSGRLLLPLWPNAQSRPNLVLVGKLKDDLVTKNLGPAPLRSWCKKL